METSNNEPLWKARKAAFDARNDNLGPYLAWMLDTEEEKREKAKAAESFLEWARENLGQGYSLACEDGVFIDTVTYWAFASFLGAFSLPQKKYSL